MRGLEGKRVLITGGASGIGAATAAGFWKKVSAVCVLDRDAAGRQRIQHDLPDLAGPWMPTWLDSSQVRAAAEDADRLMGGLDVVINNAGISIRHPFLEITCDEWDRVVAVNLSGVFHVAQAAARHMWSRNGGVILQTASTNGIVGQPFYADYNATKAGVIELTKCMALELTPKFASALSPRGTCSLPCSAPSTPTRCWRRSTARFPCAATLNRKRLPRYLHFWHRATPST